MRSAFLCVLALSLASMGSPQDSCEQVAALLSRAWRNELGSTMLLLARPDGSLTGTYNTAAGNATGWYPLVGRMTCAEGHAPTVAFAVGWENQVHGSSGSSTAWSGQLLGPKRLATTWLLTRGTDAGDAWSATRVGTNTFQPADDGPQ